MKKVIWAVVAGVLLFAAVIAAVMWNNFRMDREEAQYAGVSTPTLPVVYFELLGWDTNTLLGYRDQDESVQAVDCLLPVSEDGEISLKIYADGAQVDSATALLYSLDGERLIEQTELSLSGEETVEAQYQMSTLAQLDEEYLLTLELLLLDGSYSYYSIKVCQYDDDSFENKSELLSFALSLSDASCENDTDTLSSYISYDSDSAGTDLSFVNISTDVSLVAWGGLSVEKGQTYLRIYEWYDTQLSMAFEYDALLSYDDESTYAAVLESFCVRVRDGSLFLLNYERSASEYFNGDATNMGSTSILLGIQSEDSLDVLYTDSGENIYFTVDGGVWHYSYSDNTLICVFTFGEDRLDPRLSSSDCEVRLLGVYEDVLYFTVQGRMQSGSYEGSRGILLYGYDIEAAECREYLYAALTGSDQDGVLTALTDDGLFYMNLGDSIYSYDLTGTEVLNLYEGLDISTIMVSESGAVAVWQYEDQYEQICVLDTKTGIMQSIVGERDLVNIGFIGDDLVYAQKAKEQAIKEGFVIWQFYDKICIVDGALEEQAVYEKDDILIGEVTLQSNGVTLSRYQMEGDEWTAISDDVLTLAGETEITDLIEIKIATSDAKRNYYYINLIGTIDEGDVSFAQANMLLREGAQVSDAFLDLEDEQYLASVFGESLSRTDSLVDAIEAVYTRMGAVYKNGYLSEVVWNRDARDLYLTITLPTMTWTQAGYEDVMAAMTSLERGVDIFIYAGVNEGVVDSDVAQSAEREACESVYEELTLTFGEHLVNLTGSEIGYLLYYINLRHPVLCLTAENESLIITGYTSSEITIYDPATRETYSLEQDEAQEYFDSLNTIFVSFW